MIDLPIPDASIRELHRYLGAAVDAISRRDLEADTMTSDEAVRAIAVPVAIALLRKMADEVKGADDWDSLAGEGLGIAAEMLRTRADEYASEHEAERTLA